MNCNFCWKEIVNTDEIIEDLDGWTIHTSCMAAYTKQLMVSGLEE